MRQERRVAAPLARGLGAGLLCVSAGIHIDLYVTGYSAIPTIGPLFLVQAIVAIILAGLVLVRPFAGVFAAAALFTSGTLAGYLLSRVVGVFGFHEVATTAGLAAGVVETAAILVFGVLASGGAALPTFARSALSPARVQRLTALVTAAALGLTIAAGLPGAASRANAPRPVAIAANAVRVYITNFAFLPSHIIARPGQEIVVHNEDHVTHTLTAIKGPPGFGDFNTGDIPPGGTREFTAPRRAGTYRYHCTIHPFMLGVLTVT